MFLSLGFLVVDFAELGLSFHSLLKLPHNESKTGRFPALLDRILDKFSFFLLHLKFQKINNIFIFKDKRIFANWKAKKEGLARNMRFLPAPLYHLGKEGFLATFH